MDKEKKNSGHCNLCIVDIKDQPSYQDIYTFEDYKKIIEEIDLMLNSQENDKILHAIRALDVIVIKDEFIQKLNFEKIFSKLLFFSFAQKATQSIHTSSLTLICNFIVKYRWTATYFWKIHTHLICFSSLVLWSSKTYGINNDIIASQYNQKFINDYISKIHTDDLQPEKAAFIINSFLVCGPEYYNEITQLNFPSLLIKLMKIHPLPSISNWVLTSLETLLVQPWLPKNTPITEICQYTHLFLTENSIVQVPALSILAFCSLPNKVPQIAVTPSAVQIAIQLFLSASNLDLLQSSSEYLCNASAYLPEALNFIIASKVPHKASQLYLTSKSQNLRIVLLYLLQNCVLKSDQTARAIMSNDFTEKLEYDIKNDCIIIKEQACCFLTRIVSILPIREVLNHIKQPSAILSELLDTENEDVKKDIIQGLICLCSNEDSLDPEKQEAKQYLTTPNVLSTLEDIIENGSNDVKSMAEFLVTNFLRK